VESRIDALRGQAGRSVHRLLMPDGGEWSILRLFPAGRLRRVTVERYAPAQSGPARPVLSVNASADCQVVEGRRLVYGGAPAPGVTPVALRAGEVGYFGHFVVTIAVEPGRGTGTPYALSVADARIDPAPADLDDLLRRDGLDPTYVRRIPAERFPCPWTVPRLASAS